MEDNYREQINTIWAQLKGYEPYGKKELGPRPAYDRLDRRIQRLSSEIQEDGDLTARAGGQLIILCDSLDHVLIQIGLNAVDNYANRTLG